MSEFIQGLNIAVLALVLGVLFRVERRIGSFDVMIDTVKRFCPLFTRAGCPVRQGSIVKGRGGGDA